MVTSLQRLYVLLLAPAIAGCIAVFLLEKAHGPVFVSPPYPEVIVPLVFIFSVVFAVALPILCRSLFANKMRGRQYTSAGEWLRFERILLCVAMVTPFFALAAHILRLPRFHYAGTAIMALYAVYYYYPSKRRIAFDKRIFRVRE